MRVLAFDPGYGRTGWGVVERGQNVARLKSPGYGVLETPAGRGMPERIGLLYADACALLARFEPDCVVMERLFFNRSATTAAGVYQAQGALLAAIGSRSCTFVEIGPSSIKQAVTGSGRANKTDVMRMVQKLLGILEPIRPDDAADALAGAIAGLQQNQLHAVLARSGVPRP